MKVTLITPQVGRKIDAKYIRTWQMEPLPIATLAGLTPKGIEIEHFDERIEPIDFNTKTDLVGIHTETYTAKRSYEICEEFRKRGIPTIIGGYHAMLIPDEVSQYADSVMVGYAEGIWPVILQDLERGKLKKYYKQKAIEEIKFSLPNRDIFQNKKYLKLHCVETVRGCPYRCNFCAIAAATKSTCVLRPIDIIIEDIKKLKYKLILFVDDNIFGNISRAEELFRRLIPLKVKWVSQGSLNLSRNERVLELMKESGCQGLLVGFESFNSKTLELMDKHTNIAFRGDYKEAVKTFHKYGIGLYATFVFGYDSETLDDLDETVERAIDLKFFMAAFNHLVPFPGTPLYKQLLKQKRLTNKKWWLDPKFRYGQAPFLPKNYTSEELRDACIAARRKFFSFPSLLKRLTNFQGNLSSPLKIGAYLYANYMLGKEVDQKAGLPLGNSPHAPTPQKTIN